MDFFLKFPHVTLVKSVEGNRTRLGGGKASLVTTANALVGKATIIIIIFFIAIYLQDKAMNL